MALHEEQNPQEKVYWQAHLVRERLDISESVKQSLADSSSLDEWSDDEQQYVPVDAMQSCAELVPPRLSLQSKVQPSVRPESFVQSATAEIAAQQKSARKQEEQNNSQNPGFLARLTQRFTSSIAAIMQPEETSWEPSRRENAQDVPRERHLTPLPSYQPRADNTTRVIDAIPAPSSSLTSPSLPTVKSKQRLAGHTGKILLQTAEIPQVHEQPQVKPYANDSDIYGWHRETKEPLREPLTVNVRLREKAPDSAPMLQTSHSPHPVVDKIARETQQPEKTSVQSTVTPQMPKSAGTYFGAGTIEQGQGDLMVRNEHVTETGVVHITLTSNPGPTLIQYISLHPEVGFTLHLTAPVDVKTTFNYVLFTDGTVSKQ